MKKLAHSLSVRIHCFETEDESKVLEALKTVTDLEPERKTTDEYLGSRIKVFTAKTDKWSEIRAFLEDLKQNMSSEDLERIKKAIDRRFDSEGTFLLKLSKDKAVKGEIALGEGIGVRIKFVSFPFTLEGAKKSAIEALG